SDSLRRHFRFARHSIRTGSHPLPAAGVFAHTRRRDALGRSEFAAHVAFVTPAHQRAAWLHCLLHIYPRICGSQTRPTALSHRHSFPDCARIHRAMVGYGQMDMESMRLRISLLITFAILLAASQSFAK